jgi:hypothetical protein
MTVYSTLDGYLNAPADKRWLNDYDHVAILLNRETNQIAFEPVDEETEETYALSRSDGDAGADVSTNLAFRELGIDEGDITETVELGLEEDDGRVIVDTEPLFTAASVTSGNHSESIESDGEDDAGDEEEDADLNQQSDEALVNDDGSENDADDIEVDNDARRALIDWALGVTANGRSVFLESREIAREIASVKATAVGQHLRYLRDQDEIDLPFDISYQNKDDWDRGKWKLSRDGDEDDDAEDPEAVDENEEDLAELQALIDDGVTDVHELSALTDINTNRIRKLTRGAGIYGQLSDAAEGGAYGRSGDD